MICFLCGVQWTYHGWCKACCDNKAMDVKGLRKGMWESMVNVVRLDNNQIRRTYTKISDYKD